MITVLAVAFFVGGLVAAGDIMWALYALAVNHYRPVAAGLAAIGIVLVGAISTLAFVSNHWMVLPSSIGAFVGTYCVVEYKRRHRTPEPEIRELVRRELAAYYNGEWSL